MLVIRMRVRGEGAVAAARKFGCLRQRRGLAIKETLPSSRFWSKGGTLLCSKREKMGISNEK